VSAIPFEESLLILSDVHLGNDLNDLRPRGAGSRERRSEQVDVDLAALLAHYAHTPPSGHRWRLIIAGDFIDFIGMAILPGDHELDTAPSEEERAHGLGNASDHGRLKLRAVVARHRPVFQALADFVAQGHALTMIHGNHDVEFHWDGVKDDLRALLVQMALGGRGGRDRVSAGDQALARELAGRIEFAPWFYYAAGVAYVEHGHQYDTLCSTEHIMAPLSPRDPRRIARSFSDVLLRWVVRPTHGVPEYGHERLGILDYVMMGVHMGAWGLFRLLARFLSGVVELFRLRRAYLTEAAQTVREEHERRMGALAVKLRIGIEKLRELAALQVPPVTRSVPKILAGVLLDRLMLGLTAGMALTALAVFAGARWWSWAAMGTVALFTLLAYRQLRAQRRAWFGEKLDPDAMLIERAGRLATLFPAAFVVMGHTHSPVMVPVARGTATYVNVGSWHEAEDDKPAAFKAARTHLVIHPAKAGAVGEFLAWAPAGPTKFPAG
jgi:UDP-2,3-diacylglucosamine pyrophosphatase LpxH